VAARVAAARRRQEERYAALNLDGITTNAACPPALLEEIAQPDPDGLSLIRDVANAMRLSARGFHRVLKVGRTLADLDGEDRVRRIHVAEALSYRAHADRRPAAA
jgi:magnesium chelatase family protein